MAERADLSDCSQGEYDDCRERAHCKDDARGQADHSAIRLTTLQGAA